MVDRARRGGGAVSVAPKSSTLCNRKFNRRLDVDQGGLHCALIPTVDSKTLVYRQKLGEGCLIDAVR